MTQNAACRNQKGTLVGLKSAAMTFDADTLGITWVGTEAFPTIGRVFLSAFVDNYGTDGNGPSFQVGAAFIEGVPSDAFSYDFSGNLGNVTLPLPATMPGKTFTLIIPRDAVPGIEDTPGWTAYLSLDGEDVSECTP